MSVLRDIAIFLGGFLLLSARTGSAQVLLPGACPTVTAVTNWNQAQYMGTWFEIEKYFFIYEMGGKCVSHTHTAIGNSAFSLVIGSIDINTAAARSLSGVANKASATDGIYELNFPNVPGNFIAPYIVLGTDYTSYATVWSCKNYGLFHIAYAWVLGRARNPPAASLASAYAVLDRNKIKRDYFLKTDQTLCV